MEDIKLLVQEEGRSARNLVAFNVPVIETQCDSNLGKVMRKPPTSPRSQLDVRKEDHIRHSKRSRESSQSGSRVRSASTGRDKRSELHARYWAFLFGNLQRAVDEIYQTCESDESVTECKEVIMVLDNYTREFRNLINWFKIKWEYETTPPPQRPRSLAWEIRKSSPGKIRHKSVEPVSDENLNSSFSSSGIPLILYSSRTEKQELPPSSNENVLNGDEKSQSFSNSVLSPLQNSTVVEEDTVPSNGIEENCTLNSCDDSKSVIPMNGVTDSDKSMTAEESKEVLKSVDENILLEHDCDRDHDNVVFKVSEGSEPEMVDEICQTDPEKDVDENGPKYRSSSQQTCSILTGFTVSPEENKENLIQKNENKKPLPDNSNNTDNSVSKNLSKSRTVEEASKEENKVLQKTSLGTSKNTFSSQNMNLFTTRPQAKTSYSYATTNQTKPLVTSKTSVRIGSLVRFPRSTLGNKMSTSNVQRQPWGARPLSSPGKPLTTSVNSPAAVKLTRSRTIGEVRGPIRNSMTPKKPVKSLLGLKQESNISQSDSSKAFKSISHSNSENYVNSTSSTSLSSSASSGIKRQETESVEVLTSNENQNEEDDGWVKVRSRSRFSPATKSGDLEMTLSRSASNLKSKSDQKGFIKMVPKTRFQQPSSAISLPTLAFSISDCKENMTAKKPIKPKSDLKNKTKESVKSVKKPEKSVLEEINNKKKNNVDKVKKTWNRSSNEKYLNKTAKETKYTRMEKVENEKNKSLGAKVSTDVYKPLVDDQEALDEEENHIDEEIKKNAEREEMLQKEIIELEAADLEGEDIETGDEETDGETTTGTEEEPDQDKKTIVLITEEVEKKPSPKKQLRYEEILGGRSWADHMDTLDELEKLVVQDCSKKGMTKDEQMDTLERLEEFVARHPGRALELHQKLSSPSRRRTMLDTVKRFQARQAKASEKREQLKMAKAQKLRELLKKVDEVKAAKDKLIEDRRQRLEMKLKRAAENRNLHLKEIMRKAHDEEEKLKEIAFINELEAQNKRHDFITQCQEQEGRLQGIHEERQRKQEEKAAKEAAVEERRKAIEAERQEKLEKMQERQRKRDEQADKKKQEKEKERQELAREKARDRSERLEALHAAQLEAQEELQKKIQQKQEEYARRHEENIEQIRQKALELSISKCSDDVAPRLAPYETQKLCTACNVLIGSEVYLLSHLRGKKHQEAVKSQTNGKDLTKEEIEKHNIKIIVNAPSDKIDPKIALDKERIKSFKKKCKKIRLRMIAKGEEYLAKLEAAEKLDSPGKSKLQKCLKDIEKALSSQGKGQWSDNAITVLERSMGEINRTLTKQDSQDQLVFKSLNGFSTLSSILQLDMDVPQNMMPYLPQKCFVTASSTYLSAVNNSPSNCKFVILSNKIISLLDLLLKRLTMLMPDHTSASVLYHSKSSLPVDPVASGVMRVIAKILTCVENPGTNGGEDLLQRIQDIISREHLQWFSDLLFVIAKNILSTFRKPLKMFTAGKVNETSGEAVNIFSGFRNVLKCIFSDHEQQIPKPLKMFAAGKVNETSGEGGGNALCSSPLLGYSNGNPWAKIHQTLMTPVMCQVVETFSRYAVSVGIVDKLTRYCKSVRDPIDDDLAAAQFLLSTLELLTTLTTRYKTVRQGSEDPAQLLATLQVTELIGAVSILYGMLLHQGTPPRLIDATPPTLPTHTVAVAVGTIRFMKSVAELDLQMFQSILGAEGISLQFRHIASYLLWYCCQDKEKILLHEVVAVVGYFAVQHRDNQMILQSGSTPTVLQQLCNLPFPYFSNPDLSALLFPTLLACCSDNEENKAILEQEISYSLLEDFIESDLARNHPLIRILFPRSKGSGS